MTNDTNKPLTGQAPLQLSPQQQIEMQFQQYIDSTASNIVSNLMERFAGSPLQPSDPEQAAGAAQLALWQFVVGNRLMLLEIAARIGLFEPPQQASPPPLGKVGDDVIDFVQKRMAREAKDAAGRKGSKDK